MGELHAMELMVTLAAREMEDGSMVVVGTGAPCAAALLAQLTGAPAMVIMFEAGGVAPQMPTMPISVGDSRTAYRGLMATTMPDVMEACQRGQVDACFLGGAQIDAYGNLNSTMIGADYERPRVRFPGSGGANDLASLCWRTFVITVQTPRRFVKTVDFVTTPGYLDGPGAREKAGLPAGTGPYRVITDLAVMGFDEEALRMQVLSLHPGVTRQHVQDQTGFDLLWADPVAESIPPTDEDLRLLREVVDPDGYIIGRSVRPAPDAAMSPLDRTVPFSETDPATPVLQRQ